ncbi:SRPBCC domain-containing protein [Flavihumibacter sp. RY-1]|uniref:SRPBCC domain-containing protein n=1 Tax=Flavihumibacter fluminis TaxID=2909236 RepID=A0ABS9BNY6_9BACT|nr:SRPBCC domain-containing protein [Flavihumibacter fluminis]MCF1716767.1 SRPBCC domain-containing protein [Flavihumibacter fluminis]
MKDFKKYFMIPVDPEQLYRTLTNPATVQLWAGADAVMSEEPDSEFSLWEESIVGKNLEFEPGKKIVQEWYFGEDAEAPSIVTIKLHEHKQGTSMEVRQTNIPDDVYDEITEGWEEVYISSLLDFYSEG